MLYKICEYTFESEIEIKDLDSCITKGKIHYKINFHFINHLSLSKYCQISYEEDVFNIELVIIQYIIHTKQNRIDVCCNNINDFSSTIFNIPLSMIALSNNTLLWYS